MSLPELLTSIGTSAFSGCSSLAAISIPPRVTAISRFACGNCVSLVEIELPEGIGHPAMHTFVFCNGLNGVDLLLAYALNLDPTQNLTRRQPRPRLVGSDLEIQSYALAQGITYQVECSTDLLRWQSAGIILSAPDEDGMSRASISLQPPHRFLRLVVSE